MTKFVLIAAALGLAAPALAATPLSFQRDDVDFVGSFDRVGDTQIIQGRDRRSGVDYDLHVRKGYVTGTIDGKFVSYAAPKRASVQTASR